jgi:hypothetical protein
VINKNYHTAAVLTLVGRDPFKGRQTFFKVHQSLPRFSFYLRLIVACSSLGWWKFENILNGSKTQKV